MILWAIKHMKLYCNIMHKWKTHNRKGKRVEIIKTQDNPEMVLPGFLT